MSNWICSNKNGCQRMKEEDELSDLRHRILRVNLELKELKESIEETLRDNSIYPRDVYGE